MSFFREKEIQALLQRALNFSDGDLQANRVGLLSDDQKAALRTERLWALFIVGTIGTVISIFILFASVPLVVALIPISVALFICAVVHLNTEALLQRGTVDSVTGIARRSISVTASQSGEKKHVTINTHYQILIGDKSFGVGKTLYDAFVESEVYTLYYIQSVRILSGEMILPAQQQAEL